MYKGFQSQPNMPEDQERCLKCGKQQGLQGVALTIGRRTFHLFYLCSKCGNVGIEELLKIIRWYKEKENNLIPRYSMNLEATILPILIDPFIPTVNL